MATMFKFGFYLQFQCYDIFKKIRYSRKLTLRTYATKRKDLIKSGVDHLGFWEARISSKSSKTANKYVWKSRDNTKSRQTPLPEWSSDRILSSETHNRREVQRLRLSWFCRGFVTSWKSMYPRWGWQSLDLACRAFQFYFSSDSRTIVVFSPRASVRSRSLSGDTFQPRTNEGSSESTSSQDAISCGKWSRLFID